jgi:hypothetical protein
MHTIEDGYPPLLCDGVFNKHAKRARICRVVEDLWKYHHLVSRDAKIAPIHDDMRGFCNRLYLRAEIGDQGGGNQVSEVRDQESVGRGLPRPYDALCESAASGCVIADLIRNDEGR